jgi:hypothetical protein
MFGPKNDGEMGGCRRLHNEEFHSLYASPNIRMIKLRRWVGHAARMVEMRNAYEIFVGKPKGKRPLKRNKRT